MMLSSYSEAIARIHPVHLMNAEQRQTAADLWTNFGPLVRLNRQLNANYLSAMGAGA